MVLEQGGGDLLSGWPEGTVPSPQAPALPSGLAPTASPPGSLPGVLRMSVQPFLFSDTTSTFAAKTDLYHPFLS